MSCCGQQKKEIKNLTSKQIKKINTSNVFYKMGIFLLSIIIYPIFPFILFYLLFLKKYEK